MKTAIHEKVERLCAGGDPSLILRMRSGWAVLKATGARRINYALFGNAEPALHAHVIPRFDDEPEALRGAHPWSYDWSAAPRFNPAEHGRLLEAIRAALITRVSI